MKCAFALIFDGGRLTGCALFATLSPMLLPHGAFHAPFLLGTALLIAHLPASAHGREELKAYDAYFCPALELTDEQKSELVPHIRKRHAANREDKFKNRTDATLFGVDLTESKAAKDLHQPEDRAVRKILDLNQARLLEKWLKENAAQIEKAKTTFPPLEGEFASIRQALSSSENNEWDLNITLEATVPSSHYQWVQDDVRRDGDTLIINMSIIRPHPFKLYQDSPNPRKLSHDLKVGLPLPKRMSIAIREIPEFSSDAEYPFTCEQPVLDPSGPIATN